MAEKFAATAEAGAINLIICDIREDLEMQLIADVKKAARDTKFKNIHFYKTNLSDSADVDNFWRKITT